MKTLQYNTDNQYKWPVKDKIDDLDIEQIVALKNYLAYRKRAEN